jgi:DHA1 family multidrug resistance protein-like MFS transporter
VRRASAAWIGAARKRGLRRAPGEAALARRLALPAAAGDNRPMDRAPRQERLNLWATCAAQFLTLAGMTAVLPLIPLYLQHIGVTDRATLKYWTGAIGAAPFAVAVFATPLWGALADRLGYKPMVVRSVFGIAISTAGMGFSGTPLALLLWRGVQGAVSGVFPAAVALVSALTPDQRVGRSLALLQSARAGGALCGPLFGLMVV